MKEKEITDLTEETNQSKIDNAEKEDFSSNFDLEASDEKSMKTDYTFEKKIFSKFFKPLGNDGKNYYSYVFDLENIVATGMSDKAVEGMLINLAPPEFLKNIFPKEVAEGKPAQIDKARAAEFFFSIQREKGSSGKYQICGMGAYQDNGEIIINTGEKIMKLKGEKLDYRDYDSDNLYVHSKLKFELPKNIWTMEDRKDFFVDMNTFGWKNEPDPYLMLGWCAIAPWSSLLARSPHIWITGSKGSGKTWLIDECIKKTIGKQVFRVEGGTTEAAIRQTVRNDCRPVIIDEFDPGTRKEMTIQSEIMRLMRSAYSGEALHKGGKDNNPTEFHSRTSFCFASIQSRLESATNASRFAQVEIGKKKGNFKGKVDAIGLKGLIFSRLEELIESEKIIRDDLIAVGVDDRMSDTYAPLFAGAWIVLNDIPYKSDSPEKEEFKKLYTPIKESIEEKGQEDEDLCIDWLFSFKIQVEGDDGPTRNLLVSECIESILNGIDKDLHNKALERNGLKVILRDGQHFLCIAKNFSAISNHMADHGYPSFYEILKRHGNYRPGTKDKNPQVKIGGRNTRPIQILLTGDLVSSKKDDENTEKLNKESKENIEELNKEAKENTEKFNKELNEKTYCSPEDDGLPYPTDRLIEKYDKIYSAKDMNLEEKNSTEKMAVEVKNAILKSKYYEKLIGDYYTVELEFKDFLKYLVNEALQLNDGIEFKRKDLVGNLTDFLEVSRHSIEVIDKVENYVDLAVEQKILRVDGDKYSFSNPFKINSLRTLF